MFDDLYHQAKPKVARITVITTTSMIAVELMRSSRSAADMGPFGLRTPSEQPPSVAVPIKTTGSTGYRMSDLVSDEVRGVACGSDSCRYGLSFCPCDDSRSCARG